MSLFGGDLESVASPRVHVTAGEVLASVITPG